MKCRVLVVWAMLVVVGVRGSAFAQDETGRRSSSNLVPNGDFSDLQGNTPAGWRPATWGGSAQFEVDRAVGHNETPCVKISSADGADASWSCPVTLKPHTDYRLTVWAKTDDIRLKGGLGVQVNWHELQMVGKSDPISGSNDWTQLTSEFNSGEHDGLLLNLLLGGWGQATGTAWFDDVELIEIGSSIPTMTEAEAAAFFDSQIKPILEERCFECHGDDPEELSGGLALTSPESIIKGGDSGPVLDVQTPTDSRILQAINYQSLEMPPTGKIPQDEIDLLTTWVKMGIPWGTPIEVAAIESNGGAKKKPEPAVTPETKRWWSFQKVSRPRPPQVANEGWVQNDIDRFVLAKLEAAGLEPAPPASRYSLVRRAYYDLIGLPPTPEQVEQFVNDPDPQAYERLVDRLLASPHYGEKWGRHWLDLVRYAESNSFERDGTKPFIWRYRDYVIQSLNQDKPYDQFIREQIAGDELPEVTPETIIATGYYRLGAWDDEPADPLQAKYDDLDDILATTCQTIIGLTVNCARCHNHKIDPIPQADYYRMLSFFNNIRRYGVRDEATVVDASIRSLGQAASPDELSSYNARLAGLESDIKAVEDRIAPDLAPVEQEEFQYPRNRPAIMRARIGKWLSQGEFDTYQQKVQALAELKRSPPAGEMQILCVKESNAEKPSTHVLMRGNPHVLGPQVEPGFLSVLSPPEPEIETPPSGNSWGGRLAFANWLTRADHPLTARVLANRLWQFHFGRGIVRTASDFGFQGLPPTHPELLDWLASELIDRGWKLKSMHKLIMTSAAYQMSSDWNDAAYAADPANDLLWHFDMRRLSAEEIRDSILAVNGTLNLQAMFGPSFFSELAPEVLAGQSKPGDGWGTSAPEDRCRRSVYIHVKRSLKDPLLANFDAADTDFTCPVRFVTTQPTQALGLLNSPFSDQQAKILARDVARLSPDNLSRQVETVLKRVTQREPAANEIEQGVQLIERLVHDDRLTLDDARKYFCLLALNLNEFVYVD